MRHIDQKKHSKADFLPKKTSILAEKIFPNLADDRLRFSTVLKGMRYRQNLTQKELAKKLCISVVQLSHMENAKKPIDTQMARKLAEALQTDYRIFIK